MASFNTVTGQLTPSTTPPGSYVVTYTILPNACILGNSSSVNVDIIASPTLNTTFSYVGGPFCIGAAVNPLPTTDPLFTSLGLYSAPAGVVINSTTGQIDLTLSTAGTYTITYTLPAGPCNPITTGTTSVTISSGGTAVTGFNYSAATYCTGDAPILPNFVLLATSSGIFTASPLGLNINSATGLVTPNLSSVGTYTITYEVLTSGCIIGNLSTFTLSISAGGIADNNFTLSPSSVCLSSPNPTIIPSITQTVGGSYTSLPAGLSITSGGLIDLSTSIAGVYSISYTTLSTSCLTGGTFTQALTVTDAPLANAGADVSLCNATTYNLTGSTTGTGIGNWSMISGPNLPTYTNSSLANTTVNGLLPGVYQLQWSVNNGICPASNDVTTITIAPAPTVSNAGSTITLCDVTSTNLAANAPSSGTGTWTQTSGPAGAIFANNNDPLTNVSGLVIGSTYNFTWTISTGATCPNSTSTVVVNVNTIPDATFAAVPSFLCTYDLPINLAPTTPGGIFTPIGGLAGNVLSPSSMALGGNSITYSISVGGCSATTSQNTTLNVPPVVTITGLAAAYCLDQMPTTIFGSPAAGTWTVTGTGAATVAGTSLTAPSAGNNNITFTYTDLATGCVAFVTQPVAINNNFNSNFVGLALAYCENSPAVALTPITAGGTFFGAGMTGNQFNPSSLPPGLHTVGYTVGTGICQDTTYQTVTINQFITPTIDSLQSTYCIEAACVPLYATPPGGVWFGNGVGANQFCPGIAGVGSHSINYVYTNGACVDTATQIIDVINAPLASVIMQTNSCPGDTFTVVYTGQTAGVSGYYWEFEDAIFVQGTGSGPYQIIWDEPGFFNISLQLEQLNGCNSDTSWSIQVTQPQINTIENTSIHLGESITLATTTIPAINNEMDFIWTPSVFLDCDDCEQPIATPELESVTYMVMVTDTNGCSATDQVTITTFLEDEVFIPSAFTPNADGNNDTWMLYTKDVKSIEISVYNRWGEKVFYSTDMSTGWDATFKGQPVDPAVFVYTVDVEYNNLKRRIFKGNLTVIR